MTDLGMTDPGTPDVGVITDVHAALYRVRLPRPWSDKVLHTHVIRSEVTSGDGRRGHGWSWLPDIGPAAAHRLVVGDCRDFVRGRPAHPVLVWDPLWAHLHEAGSGGLTTIAMAAIDTALWDLQLTALGVNLPGLLGARRQSVPSYGSGVNLHLDMAQLVAQAERWVAAGYDAVKIKVGRPSEGDDVDRVAAVREAIGPNRRLMVDANQRWDLATARRRLDALAPSDLTWVEEPLRADDTAGYEALRASSSVPLAVGENHHTIYQYRELLTRRACDVVQPNVVRVGGITPWLRIAALAHAFGVAVQPHHLPEISAQLAMTLPGAPMVEVIEDATFASLGALVGPGCAVADGPSYRLTSSAGLGLEIDPSHLERLDA
jgi:L-alanine-DL-glutamate epimerase-like enolase superfamily enzyme